MSRGLGKLQRRLLAHLRASGEWHTTDELVASSFGLRPGLTITARPSAAQLRSTRRALTMLVSAGHVYRWPGRPCRWTSNGDRHLDDVIRTNHYLRSVPTRPVMRFEYQGAVLIFASPVGRLVSQWLLGKRNAVIELARMWAPDGHQPNLLTQALAAAIKEIRREHPKFEAIVSYADPGVGHKGGVYKAASWVPLGRTDVRQYRGTDGRLYARRSFHVAWRDADIVARGYARTGSGGRYRFARGLTRDARKLIAAHGSAAHPASLALDIDPTKSLQVDCGPIS